MSGPVVGDMIDVAAPNGAEWSMRVTEVTSRSLWADVPGLSDRDGPVCGRLLMSEEGVAWRRRRRVRAATMPAPASAPVPASVLACAALGFPRELADFFS